MSRVTEQLYKMLGDNLKRQHDMMQAVGKLKSGDNDSKGDIVKIRRPLNYGGKS